MWVTGTQIPESPSTVSQDVHQQEARKGAKPELKPRYLDMGYRQSQLLGQLSNCLYMLKVEHDK